MWVSVCPECHRVLREKTDFSIDNHTATIDLTCMNGCDTSLHYVVDIDGHAYFPQTPDDLGTGDDGVRFYKYARQLITVIGYADFHSIDSVVDMGPLLRLAEEALAEGFSVRMTATPTYFEGPVWSGKTGALIRRMIVAHRRAVEYVTRRYW